MYTTPKIFKPAINKKLTEVIMFLIIIISVSCNSNKSVKGLKLYILTIEENRYGRTIVLDVNEREFNFLSDTEFEITPTVCYGGRFYDKNFYQRGYKYDYTYSDGRLMIPKFEMDVTLIEKDSLFICSDNTIFFKNSIVQMNDVIKKDRLNKLLSYPKNIDKFLGNEVILNRKKTN